MFNLLSSLPEDIRAHTLNYVDSESVIGNQVDLSPEYIVQELNNLGINPIKLITEKREYDARIQR